MRTGSSEPAATSRCIDCFEIPRSAALCVWLRSPGFSSLMAFTPVWFGYASAQKGAKTASRGEAGALIFRKFAVFSARDADRRSREAALG
jgi:hypothetical protein